MPFIFLQLLVIIIIGVDEAQHRDAFIVAFPICWLRSVWNVIAESKRIFILLSYCYRYSHRQFISHVMSQMFFDPTKKFFIIGCASFHWTFICRAIRSNTFDRGSWYVFASVLMNTPAIADGTIALHTLITAIGRAFWYITQTILRKSKSNEKKIRVMKTLIDPYRMGLLLFHRNRSIRRTSRLNFKFLNEILVQSGVRTQH